MVLKYFQRIPEIFCRDEFYCRFKPEELLFYFQKYGYDKSLVPYDVEYALRVCIEKQGKIIVRFVLKHRFDELFILIFVTKGI